MRIQAIACSFVVGFATLSSSAGAAPLSIVAAETVYGDLARQVGGDRVSVVSILGNPAQDPHLFEPPPSAARALARAGLVIYNGAGYDPWMPKLIASAGDTHCIAIVAGELADMAPGGNPHLWYDAAVIDAVTRTIAETLAAVDPDGAPIYAANLKNFEQAMAPLRDRIAAMRGKYAGLPVTATEPVFDYMARAVGLQMRNPLFQLAVMNDTEPAARDVAAFEDDLKGRKVRALIYNIQATGTQSEHMRHLAQTAMIPVVGISETEPPGVNYQDWMMAQLDALDAALSAAPLSVSQ